MRAGRTRRPVRAMRARAHFSPAKEMVTATATSAGADGSTATRSRAAPSGTPGIMSAWRRPPSPRSSPGSRRKRRAGLSRVPEGRATSKIALRARSAATTSESWAPWTASPPTVAMPRIMRDAEWARAAAGRSPAVASWTSGESMTSWRVTIVPMRRSPSTISVRPSPSADRSRTFGTSRSAANRRVPPAKGMTPWRARLSASSIRVGRW